MAQIVMQPSRRGRDECWIGIDSWNNIIVASLAFGALAAVIVGVSTYVIIRLKRQKQQRPLRSFHDTNSQPKKAYQMQMREPLRPSWHLKNSRRRDQSASR